MDLCLNLVKNYDVSALKNKVYSFFTTHQQKVTAVALAALACAVTYYIIKDFLAKKKDTEGMKEAVDILFPVKKKIKEKNIEKEEKDISDDKANVKEVKKEYRKAEKDKISDDKANTKTDVKPTDEEKAPKKAKPLLNGPGEMTLDDITYEGTFKDGLLHGKGKKTDADTGKKYEGEFENGKLNGKGKVTSKIAVYEGTFQNDYLEGQGKISYADKRIYEGMVVKNLPDGKGIMKYPDGRVVDGNFKYGNYVKE